jgi:OPT family oligopeptide transporter
MDSYPDVPDWVFLVFLFVMIFVQVAVSLWTPFTMPVWSVFLCIGITFIFLLPIGVIQAITGLQLGLNVLTEFVIGLLIPGQTVAVMAFKSLGTNTIIQALALLGDLKLGHYMKINPIHMIVAQLYGTVIGAVINNSISIWAESLLSNLMFISPDWNPVSYGTFYSAGAIWGAIGPERFFGIGSIYESLLMYFAYGITLPIIPWLGNKVYKAEFWHHINIPVLSTGAPNPGSFQNVVLTTLFLAWFFQYYIFNRHHEWWKKYNYILSAGLDCGVAFSGLLVTLLQETNINFPHWYLNPQEREAYCKP